MKIDFAIVASDDNPMYLDFWPLTSKLWHRLGIMPVLLYFGENHISMEGGMVIKMSAKQNVPLATCWARYWWAGQQGEKVSIISDIDMLPFSHTYFVEQLERYSVNDYVHINPCIDTYNRLPSCYHVASGVRFKECLELDSSFDVSLENLLSNDYDNSGCYSKNGGNDKWCFDEFYATQKLLTRSDIIYIKRKGGQNGRRIDRANWVYSERRCKADYYIDSHSLRPYSENKDKIDRLLSFFK